MAKGKNKLPKDERPMKTKMKQNDQYKSRPHSSTRPSTHSSTQSSTKKYTLSSAAKHISTIDIKEEDVDKILILLLELEMNEKGFDSMEACVENMLEQGRGAGDREVESPEDDASDSDSSSDSDSDSDSDSESDSDVDGDSDNDSEGEGEGGRDNDSVDHSDDDSDNGEKALVDNEISQSTEVGSITAIPSQSTDYTQPTQPANFTITPSLRKFMLKKLVRDDRRVANELKAKKYEEKMKQKLIKKERYEKEQEKLKAKSKGRRSDGVERLSSAAAPGLSSQDSKLRIHVCSQKSKTSRKLMLIDRDRGWTVEKLVADIRTKLNEPKKFNSLMIMPSKKSFEDEDIRFFENDTQLCLFPDSSKTNKKTPVKENKKLVNAVSSIPDSSTAHIKTKVAKSDEVTPPPSVVEDNGGGIVGTPRAGSCQEVDPTELVPPIDPTIDLSSPVCHDESVSASLLAEKEAMCSQSRYESVLQGRKNLPMFKARESFLNELKSSENKTLIVVGDTGCGKTTQVPQIIYDDMIDNGKGSEAFIICTQPRRIAAISVAERVSQERLQRCGQSVGYQIRLKSKYSQRDTRILFCTTGILLRKMQNQAFLSKVSHIIIDEVHERQVETDFLMAILRTEMSFRPDLRLVLMSATLNSEHLRGYMSQCPVVTVPGRLFPVAVHYMQDINAIISAQQKISSSGGDSRVVREDMLHAQGRSSQNKKPYKGKNPSSSAHSASSNSILPFFNADTVAEFIIRLIEKESYAAKKSNQLEREMIGSKAILVFLSGIQAITAVNNILRHRHVLDKLKAKVFILHSSIPSEQQNKVFAKLQSPFEWKIVLSTNIAESSVTVDDVVHVIDTGFVREMTFDPVSRVSLLSTVFASKASLTQRCGRAGRVRPGDCWRLFSEEFVESPRLQEYSLPEIKRVPLEDVVLQILILQLGNPREFLSKCMDPPSAEQVDEALQVLLEIGAITATEKDSDFLPEGKEGAQKLTAAGKSVLFQPFMYSITPLGHHLANLPVDVRLGKMLIYASIFGCLEPALTIVATLSGKSPMVTPPNKRDEANAAHAKFCVNTSKKNKHPFFMGVASVPGQKADGKGPSARPVMPSLYSPYSDHIAFVRIYDTFINVHKEYSRGGRRGPEVYNFCQTNHLSMKVLDDITALREQFRKYLNNAGFLSSSTSSPSFDELIVDVDSPLPSAKILSSNELDISCGDNNRFSMSDAIVRCVICAGLFPRVVRACRVQSHSSSAKTYRNQQFVQKIFEPSGDTVNVHATSLLCRHNRSLLDNGTSKYKDSAEKKKEAFVVYYKKISSPNAQLYDCTEVSPVSLMLFGDSFSESVGSKRSKVIVNNWIHLGISEYNAVLIRKLRDEVEQILLAKADGVRVNACEKEKFAQSLQKKQYLVTSILEKLLEQLYV